MMKQDWCSLELYWCWIVRMRWRGQRLGHGLNGQLQVVRKRENKGTECAVNKEVLTKHYCQYWS